MSNSSANVELQENAVQTAQPKVSKFLFEGDEFDATLDDLPSITPRQQKAFGHEKFQEGFTQAQASIEKYSMEVLNACHENIRQLIEAEKNVVHSYHKEISELCQQILCKVLPATGDAGIVKEIKSYLEETLKEIPEERNFKLFCHPELVETLKAFIQDWPHKGTKDVNGDATLSKLDCRIEWDGGGIQHYTQSVLEKIDFALSRLSGQEAHPKIGQESAAQETKSVNEEIELTDSNQQNDQTPQEAT